MHDGYVLNNSVVQSPVGGQLLTDALRHNLTGKGAKLQPWYMYRAASGGSSAGGDNGRAGAVTASAAAWGTDFITADIKESLCRVNEVPFVEEENLNMPVQSYELPDGSSVDIGVERFKIPEILFNSVRAPPAAARCVVLASDCRSSYVHPAGFCMSSADGAELSQCLVQLRYTTGRKNAGGYSLALQEGCVKGDFAVFVCRAL